MAMARESRDEELEFVLAFSQKTFLEEEQRRIANDNDLIHLEGGDLQERERQETIRKIKRLYSHPSNLNTLDQHTPPHHQQLYPTPSIGWSPLLTTQQRVPQLQQQPLPPTTHQHAPFPPIPVFPAGGPSSFYPIAGPSVPLPNTSAPPPLYPRIKRTSESATHQIRPNWSAQNTSFSHLPTASSATLPPPLPTRRRSPNEGHPTSTPPPHTTATPLPVRLSSVVPVQDECPSVVREIYVPYCSIGTPRMVNGDLIDLEDMDREASTMNEDIWREFDPLYRDDVVTPPPHPPPSLPPPQLHPSSSASAIDTTPQRAKSVVVARDIVRNAQQRKSLPIRPTADKKETETQQLELDCLNDFRARTPSLFEQLDALHTDSQSPTPPLRFHSALAPVPTTADSVKIVVFKDHSWKQSSARRDIPLTVDTSVSVDFILSSVVLQFLDEEGGEDERGIDDYCLKVYGLDEILPNDSIFGRNLYVGKCLLQGKEIKLEVGRRDASRSTAEVRRESLGRLTSQISATCVIDPEDIHQVSLHLKPELMLFEEAVRENQPLKVAHHQLKIKQLVKLLCTRCGNIQPVGLHNRLNKYLNAGSAQLPSARNDMIGSLHGLIYSFCESSLSMHCLAPLRKPSDIVRFVDNSEDRLHVMANSLHNIPDEWSSNYREFLVRVHFYHGVTAIETAGEARKKIKTDALFPYIDLSLYATFDRMLCTTPREGKFFFSVWGIPQAVQTGDSAPADEAPEHLGSATLPLFDHNRILRRGQFFLPLRADMDGITEPWGGMPIIGTGQDAVLAVTLPVGDDVIKFPEVEADQEENRARHESSKYAFSTLLQSEQELLMDLLENQHIELSQDDKELLWQRRHYLTDYPEALALILESVGDWSVAFLPSIYECLDAWAELPPIMALTLLLPKFPDERVRAKAIQWIDESSKRSSDFVFSFLPQLVEALRFELHEDSALARFLVDLTYRDGKYAFEIYWQLQQRIDHFGSTNFEYAHRCSLLQGEILGRHKGELGQQIVRQRWLLNELEGIQNRLKDIDDREKLQVLRLHLGRLDADLLQSPVALPILPSFSCCGINVSECGIFNSNAKPLRLVFKGINDTYSVIHKSGDDMRQDALVLHIVNLMNDIWKEKNLDLRMILFHAMPVGYRKGMAELVSDCATLCDIQKTHGMTGVFKDDVLNRWLMQHSDGSEFSFKQSLDNFRRSCAGWCVATYVLGIGDRHNDNILVTRRGHVFHIDFGKYMGDWQRAGGFKRDRVPFVFTQEMCYVVNQGPRQTAEYQVFIDYCTKAFNALRAKHPTLMNLLKLMACSGIPGINQESITFVENNLMLSMSENEATVQFTEMLQQSLKSAFPRINFAIHTVAQIVSGGSLGGQDNNKLSFVPQLYNEQTDGRITQVTVQGVTKMKIPSKIYMYRMEVIRANSVITSVVSRSFSELNEFYIKLRRRFPSIPFPQLTRGSNMRTNVLAVAERRLVDVETFIKFLFTLKGEVAHCDLVYTFFHSLLRDNGGDVITETAQAGSAPSNSRVCLVNLKLSYNQSKALLTVFVGHGKNFAEASPGSPPDSYIKTYLRPDQRKDTKMKTAVVKNSCNPTFNSEMRYEHMESTSSIERRLLEVSVWYSGSLENSKQYAFFFPLKKLAEAPMDRKAIRFLDEWIELRRSSSGADDYAYG
ncbi:piki-1 [Pristionchus pacificus]|nr:piki-1 [Pristionchus pacificus]